MAGLAQEDQDGCSSCASPPPCLKIPCCHSCLETSSCCQRFGTVGISSLDAQPKRAKIMYAASFLSFIGMVIQIVPLFALSSSLSTLSDVHWGQLEFRTDSISGDLFLGTPGYGLDLGWTGSSPAPANFTAVADNTFVSWGDANCDEVVVAAQSFCNECESACASSATFAIMSFITSIPQFQTDLLRTGRKADLACQKSFGVITGIVGTISNLISLSTFVSGCQGELPSSGFESVFGQSVELDFSFGAAFICILVATILKPLDALFHLVVPVPRDVLSSVEVEPIQSNEEEP